MAQVNNQYQKNTSNFQRQTIFLNGVNLKGLKAEDIKKSVKNFAETVGMKINQVRKFYNEVQALKNKYETEKPSPEKLKLDMALFLSKIEYGKNKAQRNEKESFEIYQKNIEPIVNQINDYNDFKNFLIIMEAIIAYYPKQN